MLSMDWGITFTNILQVNVDSEDHITIWQVHKLPKINVGMYTDHCKNTLSLGPLRQGYRRREEGLKAETSRR